MKKIFMAIMEKLLILGDIESAFWYSESFSTIKFKTPDGIYELSVTKKTSESETDEV